jgi:antitoxin component YwqK of YwqJK toxin-antitoxin module
MRILLCFLVFTNLITACSDSKKEQEVKPELVIEKRENGEIKFVGYKIGDRRVREWRTFRKNRLFSISNYHAGVQHGKETSYEFCTGKILEEGQYDMGNPIGLWYRYLDGELVAVSEYNDGESTIVYHNPKFKNASEIPPPPSENDCEEMYDN